MSKNGGGGGVTLWGLCVLLNDNFSTSVLNIGQYYISNEGSLYTLACLAHAFCSIFDDKKMKNDKI